MEQTNEARSQKLPGDVAEKLADSTKSFNRDRLVKLLRDTHYLGPIPVGQGAKKSTGANTGSPGSGMRRAKDGALYHATKAMRRAILDRALETELITEAKGGYATTPKGKDVLEMLDTCEECGRQKQPYINEYTVKISRYSSAKNYRLVTVCDECGHDHKGSLREEVRSYAGANRDDAIQALKNLDDLDRIDIYGVSADDLEQWTSPSERAAKDVRERLSQDGHTTYSLSTALFTLQDEYDDEWVPGAAEILAEDYEEHTLEYAVLKTIATGEEYEDPVGDVPYSEKERALPKVLPGEGIKATFEIAAIGREVTLVFQRVTSQRVSVLKYTDVESDLGLMLTSSGGMGKGIPVVSSHKAGVLGEVVDMEIVALDENLTETDLEKIDDAVSAWKRTLDSSLNRRVADVRTFNKFVKDYDLTGAETISFARIARHMMRERDEHVGKALENYSRRNLSS